MDELQQAYRALRQEYAERAREIATEGSEADLTRLNTEMAQSNAPFSSPPLSSAPPLPPRERIAGQEPIPQRQRRVLGILGGSERLPFPLRLMERSSYACNDSASDYAHF